MKKVTKKAKYFSIMGGSKVVQLGPDFFDYHMPPQGVHKDKRKELRAKIKYTAKNGQITSAAFLFK